MMMMKKIMMMKMIIIQMNVRNSLMIDRSNIEIFESMFDFLKFENNEIREFADLIKIEEIEIEHFENESFMNENMQ
jgi:hypothetical protein